jgi:nitrite reductase (NADH) large subunit
MSVRARKVNERESHRLGPRFRGGSLRIVIVGNNVAGTTLAKNLRDANSEVEIDIYTDEAMLYYPRPRLVDYLMGRYDETGMPFYPADWYEKNRLMIHLSSKVEKVDPVRRKILVKGMWEPYDKLALCTGSSSFIPPFKGLPKKRVFALRTFQDAKDLKSVAAASKHAIVIGGGLLGLEAARGVCTAFPELRVTILEYSEHLLMKQLDHDGATLLTKWIESTGAKVVTQAETVEVLGDENATGVRLKDGRVIEGDVIVVSAGTRANVQLAKDAGLKVNKGIVVDGYLRTSDPDIYSLGDACEFQGVVWAMIPPALDEAKVAANSMLGLPGPAYSGTVPSNTLKVVGFDLTSIGAVRSAHEPPEPGYEEIFAPSSDGKVYKKFVIKDEKLIGAILLGTKKDSLKIAKMIKEGASVTHIKQRLSDPSFTLP